MTGSVDRRTVRLIGLSLAIIYGLGITAIARAQSYPIKPIRIIVAGGAGGSIDFIGRLIGQKVGASLGQQIIIDNRGGAGGNIGAEAAARSAPDGYTLLAIGASLAINPSLYRRLQYDPVKDFTPITQATAAGYVLVVHPSVPAKNVKELIALAKSRKEGITYASPGNGQAQHLGMELLKTMTGFSAVHIPYKGGAPAVIGVAGGQADVLMSSAPAALPLLQTSKLRPIAVTSLKRLSLVPDVPTIAEAGVPNFEVSGWIGFFAPSGTPREILVKLHEDMAKGFGSPEVSDSLRASGQEIVASTPEQFSEYFKAELGKWRDVVKRSGAKVD